MNQRSVTQKQLKTSWQWRLVDRALLVLGMVAILVGLNAISQHDALRLRVDATRTRSYSLSEQTLRVLDELTGDWKIVVLVSRDRIDRATRLQLEEVLGRFDRSTDSLETIMLDPRDARELLIFDSVLEELRRRYADDIELYDEAIDAAMIQVSRFERLAQTHAAALQGAVDSPDLSVELRSELSNVSQKLALAVREIRETQATVERSRESEADQPLPEYDLARSVLVKMLPAWGDALYDLASGMDRWTRIEHNEVRLYAVQNRDDLKAMSQELTALADPLRQLAPLELDSISRILFEGDAAIVMGPEGATAIQSRHLFVETATGTGVAVDLRFRGEQVIASAIRSLQTHSMPAVVFVHAQGTSLFRESPSGADLRGAMVELSLARIDCREWIVGETPRPEFDSDQPVVWVFIPYTKSMLDPPPEANELVDAARELLSAGEPVMFGLLPSPLPAYQQPDPWSDLVAELGIVADTSRAIFEATPIGRGQSEIQRSQVINMYASDHPIALALDGLTSLLPIPVPIAIDADASGAAHETIALIARSDNRWMEKDWYLSSDNDLAVREDAMLEQPSPAILAVTRTHPLGSGLQRAIVSASALWMFTNATDRPEDLGGGRVARQFPGNHELLLSSILWLSDMDKLIAQSPVGRHVTRLRGITPGVRRAWTIGLFALALGLLIAGLSRWRMRGRS